MFVVLWLLSQTRRVEADLPERLDESQRVSGESQSVREQVGEPR